MEYQGSISELYEHLNTLIREKDKSIRISIENTVNAVRKEFSNLRIRIDGGYWEDFKFYFSSWECMVDFAYMMYWDIYHLLNKNDTKAYLRIMICGSSDENESLKKARAKDIERLLDSREANALKEKVIEWSGDLEGKYHCWLNSLERTLKRQKNAYILSKLIDNRAYRADYEDNPILIEAYDAYIDVVNAISKKPY